MLSDWSSRLLPRRLPRSIAVSRWASRGSRDWPGRRFGADVRCTMTPSIEAVTDLARRFTRRFLVPALSEGSLPDAPLQGFRLFVASRAQPVAAPSMIGDEAGTAWTDAIRTRDSSGIIERTGGELLALYQADLTQRVAVLRDALRRPRRATLVPADIASLADPTRRRSLEVRIAGGLFGDKPVTEAARVESLREVAADALVEYAIAELDGDAEFGWSGPVTVRLADGAVDARRWAADLLSGANPDARSIYAPD